MKQTVSEIVREVEDNYIHGHVSLGEYVEWDMHETIERIDAYLNSRHTSGDTDSLGREKPFFNIVTSAVNIWYRATDIDRKNIRILPSSRSDTLLAFIATVMLQNWMKEARFGVFLNDWGRSLARYGSTVTKFVERDGKLIASVVPWNRMICDPVDFDAAPRIEKVYKTPAQLRSNTLYDQDVVEKLIEARTTRKNLDKTQKDDQADYIELYEVHGELPVACLADDPDKASESDWKSYRQQMHVVSYMLSTEKGKYDDFTLFRGKEAKDPYMITHLIKEDGRTLSIGAVEYLFDAQWMKNHTVKNMKDTLDLASKLIFQTSDGNYVGRNVLSAIETGDILIHKLNEPLTQINNSKADIAAFQNFGAEWERLSQTLTSTPEAMRGDTLPSGTPYSLAAYLGGQANSLFEIMTENKGLHIEDMMREFILPHMQRKLKNKDEVVAILDSQGIAEIDTMYLPKAAIKNYNRKGARQILEALETEDMSLLPSPYQQNIEETEMAQEFAQYGNKRFFTPDEYGELNWDEVFKDFNWQNLTVEVTNENTDKGAVLQTLSSVLQTIASNPLVLQDPNAKMVFAQILTETGRISPAQLSTVRPSASPPTGDVGALADISQPTNATG